MNRTHQVIVWTLVCLLGLSMPLSAQADWYNPLTWGSSTSAPKKPKGPSTFQKINNGTKDFFYKSADFLNPFNDGDDAKTTKRTSYNGGYRSTSKKQEDSSWFGGWFSSEPEPGPPQTVSEFMDLPRPKF
ncbi:hypothetical protein DTL21_12265 [Bremerella cremea]|uniref:Uncharacterized protein n=1 Tax=Blastopirellula marina TaxID=124 RepID=A0A2S8FQI0_9BACT|nr:MULTISPECIES: hypothetical protein [Pirellulaceae]PQO34300.1 hypothetical protein C5Y83_12260 [Blastopirellula marina]RCS46796.1 hypothetical protein DTL21_12265 [Bremerella cremea]